MAPGADRAVDPAGARGCGGCGSDWQGVEMSRYSISAACVMAAVSLASTAAAQGQPYGNRLSPYVASPPKVVDRMLELAAIKPGETLYDLGCGDREIQRQGDRGRDQS